MVWGDGKPHERIYVVEVYDRPFGFRLDVLYCPDEDHYNFYPKDPSKHYVLRGYEACFFTEKEQYLKAWQARMKKIFLST